MCERVLCTVMMGIIVCVDGLCLKTSNRIEFLDGGCTQTCQCTENCTLDLSHLCVLDCVDESILGLGRMVLCHFFRQLIFRSFACSNNCSQNKDGTNKLH